MNLNELESKIALHDNFPINGVLFRDLSPLFKDHMTELIDEMTKIIGEDHIAHCDYFVGVESRGFIIASALAQKFNKGIVLIRKPGKLPGKVLKEDYTLEYGSGSLEMHEGDGKVIIVDDVLATGGTLKASCSLSEKAGYEVLTLAVCINLKDLNSFTFNNEPIKTLFEY